MDDNKGKCGCACHGMIGIMIFLIGLLFLLGNFEIISMRDVNMFWPIIVMLIGLKKSIMRGKCKCCADS